MNNQDVSDDAIRELCVMTTRDADGLHFTQWSEHWDTLEAAGLVSVHKPVHASSGIAYDQDEWSVQITEAGQDLVDSREDLHPQ